MQDFKKLDIWTESLKLSSEIYNLTKKFPKDELYGLTSQIRRASVSMFANIAEGAGRSSNPDFARFVNIAIGSTNEILSYIYLCNELNIITSEEFIYFENEIIRIKKKMINFLKILNTEQTTNYKPLTTNN
jgi:four helix bundle protein